MSVFSLSELCKCSGSQICPLCRILTVICIALISGILGYFIGKKKGGPSSK